MSSAHCHEEMLRTVLCCRGRGFFAVVSFGLAGLSGLLNAGELTCSLPGTIVNGKCEDCASECEERDDLKPNPKFKFRIVPPGDICGTTQIVAPGESYEEWWDVLLETSDNPTSGQRSTRTCLVRNKAGDFVRTGRCDFGSRDRNMLFDAVAGDARALIGCDDPRITCVEEDGEIVTMEGPADQGAQGWSWGIGTTEGIFSIAEVTTLGAVSANFRDEPPGLERSGFVDNQVTLGEGNEGAVSAIVLAQNLPVVLPPEGSAIILKILITSDGLEAGSEPVSSRLYFPIESGDLRRGVGQPVPTLVTFDGRSVSIGTGSPPLLPEDLSECNVTFSLGGEPAQPFIRCDPNNDGQHNLADPIWIFQQLFREGPAAQCRATLDCNADGSEDLSDVMYALMYQWMAGTAPPAPFPECGTDESVTAEDCPQASTNC
jgi:hypothetical protein